MSISINMDKYDTLAGKCCLAMSKLTTAKLTNVRGQVRKIENWYKSFLFTN